MSRSKVTVRQLAEEAAQEPLDVALSLLDAGIKVNDLNDVIPRKHNARAGFSILMYFPNLNFNARLYSKITRIPPNRNNVIKTLKTNIRFIAFAVTFWRYSVLKIISNRSTY